MEPLTMDPETQRRDTSFCVLDCDQIGTRGVNTALRALPDGADSTVVSPRGRHNLAVGIPQALSVTIDGHAGYFVGGLCGERDGTGPDIVVNGFVGWSVGENLMGGTIRVKGSASQSAGSSARGGQIFVEGHASLRAGISLKGGTVVIAGNAGAMTGFMAQAGIILIGGDAGHALGDSLYEAVIYVQGAIASLGADAVVEEMTEEDVLAVKGVVDQSGFHHVNPDRVTKVVSARQLYHFSGRHLGAY